MSFQKVAILGPGLLGGSMAKALRQWAPTAHIALWARRSGPLDSAREQGIADRTSTDLEVVIRGAELIVLCTPVGAMAGLTAQIAPHVSENVIITDVGSVKADVVREVVHHLNGRGQFVGSHPMAGSEQSGLESARCDLFQNSVCILTPDNRTNPNALAKVAAFWQMLGCRIETLSPERHDTVMAQVSHLPHLLAAALVNLVCTPNSDPLTFSGSGFRDTTRVASGPAPMWAEILTSNRASVTEAISRMILILQQTQTQIERGDEEALRDFLLSAKRHRDNLKTGGSNVRV